MTALAINRHRFKCPVCESTIDRQSRTQVYCSARCMRKANYAKRALKNAPRYPHSPLVPTPHKINNENNILQWPKSRSRPRHNDGICGPRKVVDIEVIAGRDWQEIVSAHGVMSYVGTLAKRALAL